MRRAAAFFALALAGPAAAGPAAPSVGVDPRIELLGIVQLLARETSGAADAASLWKPYAQDVRRSFGPFRGHPAVRAYVQAARAGLDRVDAVFLMLQATPPPELALPERTPAYVQASLKKAGGRGAAEALLKSLAGFSRDAEFPGFFKAHRELYDAMKAQALKGLAWERDVRLLEAYGGLPVTAGYAIVLSPLSGSASGINAVDLEGRGRVTSVVGPTSVGGADPAFDLTGYRWVLWHELGHTLFDGLLETRGRTGSEERELLAKGIASRLWEYAEASGSARGGEPPPQSRGDYLPRLRDLKERLKEYEERRARYPTLGDFLPRLLEVLPPPAAEAPMPGTAPLPPLRFRVGGSGSADAEAAKAQAEARYQAGDAAQAQAGFERALALSPKDPEAAYDLGLLLFVRGARAQALDAMERAAALARAGPSSNSYSGPSAAPSGRGAGKDSSTLLDALYARAAVLAALRRDADALRAYSELLAAAPPDWPSRPEIERQRQALEGKRTP